MNNLPEIDKENQEKYWNILKRLDPELYLIKIALEETKVNPRILPRVIRAIANLAYGTGYGKIQVFMSQRVVTQIKPEESDALNLDVFEEESK